MRKMSGIGRLCGVPRMLRWWEWVLVVVLLYRGQWDKGAGFVSCVALPDMPDCMVGDAAFTLIEIVSTIADS